MGAAVVNEPQRRGGPAPQDISVLGFDDTSTSLHIHALFSTVTHPLEDRGCVAVTKLLGARDLGPKTTPQLIETRLHRTTQDPTRRSRLAPSGCRRRACPVQSGRSPDAPSATAVVNSLRPNRPESHQEDSPMVREW
ncbi:hypothetical protein ACIPWF_22125 [Paenarthrobacter sp. NPDC089989]